jgi:hypothetical protein
MRTRVKNRIQATLARHNVQVSGADLFGVAARLELSTRLPELPGHCREAIEQELAMVDFLKIQIESADQRLKAIMTVSVDPRVLLFGDLHSYNILFGDCFNSVNTP